MLQFRPSIRPSHIFYVVLEGFQYTNTQNRFSSDDKLEHEKLPYSEMLIKAFQVSMEFEIWVRICFVWFSNGGFYNHVDLTEHHLQR